LKRVRPYYRVNALRLVDWTRLAGSFGAGASAAGVAKRVALWLSTRVRATRRTLRQSAGHPLDATVGGR